VSPRTYPTFWDDVRACYVAAGAKSPVVARAAFNSLDLLYKLAKSQARHRPRPGARRGEKATKLD
jgi:hypothetical protein